MQWIESFTGLSPQLSLLAVVGAVVAILVGLVVISHYSNRLLAWVLIIGLLAAHQDWWNWVCPERSIGQLPSGFVYHVGLSIMTAVAWWIVTLEAWPTDDFASDSNSDVGNRSQGSSV